MIIFPFKNAYDLFVVLDVFYGVVLHDDFAKNGFPDHRGMEKPEDLK